MGVVWAVVLLYWRRGRREISRRSEQERDEGKWCCVVQLLGEEGTSHRGMVRCYSSDEIAIHWGLGDDTRSSACDALCD